MVVQGISQEEVEEMKKAQEAEVSGDFNVKRLPLTRFCKKSCDVTFLHLSTLAVIESHV